MQKSPYDKSGTKIKSGLWVEKKGITFYAVSTSFYNNKWWIWDENKKGWCWAPRNAHTFKIVRKPCESKTSEHRIMGFGILEGLGLIGLVTGYTLEPSGMSSLLFWLGLLCMVAAPYFLVNKGDLHL